MGDDPVDIVAAAVAMLKADADVAAACGGRVFGGELPGGEARHMPRGALVLKPTGGSSLTGASTAEADTQRLDVFALHATPAQAAALLALADRAMRRLRRAVHAGVLLHWAQRAGGYSAGREPGTDWPRAFQSFQIFHSLIPAN